MVGEGLASHGCGSVVASMRWPQWIAVSSSRAARSLSSSTAPTVCGSHVRVLHLLASSCLNLEFCGIWYCCQCHGWTIVKHRITSAIHESSFLIKKETYSWDCELCCAIGVRVLRTWKPNCRLEAQCAGGRGLLCCSSNPQDFESIGGAYLVLTEDGLMVTNLEFWRLGEHCRNRIESLHMSRGLVDCFIAGFVAIPPQLPLCIGAL